MPQLDQPVPQQRIAGPAEAHRLFAPLLDTVHETAAFVFLDGEQRVLGILQLSIDAPDRVGLPIRAIAREALMLDAAAVVMAHNHPSGDATPSAADRETTRRIAHALDGLCIRLVDHLVITREGVTSFRSLGLL